MTNNDIDLTLEELTGQIKNLSKVMESHGTYEKKREDIFQKLNNAANVVGKLMPNLMSIGRESAILEGSLLKAYRTTGVSLNESVKILQTSTSLGLKNYEGSNSKLLAAIVKLGLHLDGFVDLMAHNTEVLKMSDDSTRGLMESVIQFAREFGVDSALLVDTMKRLNSTSQVLALRSDSQGPGAFQKAVAAIQGAFGKQYQDSIVDVINKTSGTTIESFARAFRIGGKPLIQGKVTAEGIVDRLGENLKEALKIANSYGITDENLPFIADLAKTQFGITPEILQLAKSFPAEVNRIKEELKQQLNYQEIETRMFDFNRVLTTLLTSVQYMFLPMIAYATKFIGDNSMKFLASVEKITTGWDNWLKTTDMKALLAVWVDRGNTAFDYLAKMAMDLASINYGAMFTSITDFFSDPMSYVNPFKMSPFEKRKFDVGSQLIDTVLYTNKKTNLQTANQLTPLGQAKLMEDFMKVKSVYESDYFNNFNKNASEATQREFNLRLEKVNAAIEVLTDAMKPVGDNFKLYGEALIGTTEALVKNKKVVAVETNF